MIPFVRTYADARARFREAARAAGGRLRVVPVPGTGPDGLDLSIDLCRIGPCAAARQLVLTSGTHGNEGLCGSAVQRDLLAHLDHLLDPHGGRLPDDTAILLVHAVNPWGMAWHRRQTAANIDLNRNFRDWSVPPPARPDYAAFHDRLCPATIEPESEAAFVAWAQALVAERGIAWVQARFTEGQWSHPRGLYHGGDGPAQENRLLHALFADELAGTRAALLVDLHTGMGAWGDHLLLVGMAADAPGAAWLAHAFAPQRLVFTGSEGERYGGRWPTLDGKMSSAVGAVVPWCTLHNLTLEYGTRDGDVIFIAERREHWAWATHGVGHPEHRRLAAELQEHMVPSDPLWQARVLAGGRAIVTDGFRALVGEGQAR
jgi:hypothetical protein